MTRVSESSRVIGVLIVDDHQVLTDALATILASEPDLQVLGVAATCAGTRDLLGRTCPDVLLLDVSLPDGDGLSLVAGREREILVYLAQGKAGPGIAAQLSIAPVTVRTHIRNLMEKLGVHSRLEAVSYALRLGLIDSPL